MSRPRFFEVVAVALTMLIAAPVASADDPLARPELDKEIALEMKDADVVDVFRHIAATTGVPFSLEFESDPSLSLSFAAKNMSVRALLSSIAHTYELKYESAGNQIAVRPTGAKPAPRPAARPVKVTADQRRPSYHFKFEVRGEGGAVLATPEVSTQLNQPLEIKQGASQGRDHVFLTFKVTPNAHIGEKLELSVKAAERRAVSDNRTITDETIDTKVVGKGPTRLFASKDRELVLVSWAIEPRAASQDDHRLYELKFEVRSACVGVVALPPVTADARGTARLERVLEAVAGGACTLPGPTILKLAASPHGLTSEGGLMVAVQVDVERQSSKGPRHVQSVKTMSHATSGETLVFKNPGGEQVFLTGWGMLEHTPARP